VQKLLFKTWFDKYGPYVKFTAEYNTLSITLLFNRQTLEIRHDKNEYMKPALFPLDDTASTHFYLLSF
jgi:hypothetical protein